jgi:hypothetical protein
MPCLVASVEAAAVAPPGKGAAGDRREQHQADSGPDRDTATKNQHVCHCTGAESFLFVPVTAHLRASSTFSGAAAT